MAELFPFSMDDKIRAVDDEIRMRQAVYGRKVQAKRMSQAAMNRGIEIMREIRKDLEWLKAHPRP